MKKSILLLMCMLAVTITANAQKFALIDMEYIFENIPAAKQANEQITQSSTKWQGEVQAVMEAAQTLYTNYQKNAGSLSEQQKTKKEEEIIAKEKEANELRKKYFGPEGELAKMQERLMKPIEDKVYNAVKEISESQGYSLILDRASATSVIFASPRIDISNEVLARLGYSN
ncbi:OmpH family outer membrane protein [Bacteroides sp. 519]|uniref:OmpH family outer membrane protein n=1 Tax=Bacteroides sp. 519 TaxID=2302937 RepID=UPI0013D32615|nr:OmpH family outer membrane protein [Bacteroides sp. 519]NDV57169.1 OmpH family outer membrane protein [Bacteroides sp. 519]